MDERDVFKSVVKLAWYNRTHVGKQPKIVVSKSSGVVVALRGDSTGLYILSTCHQLRDAYGSDLSNFPKQDMGVEVQFYDLVTRLEGAVVHFDEDRDLSLVWLQPTPQFESRPCIKQVAFTSGDLQKGQQIFCFHHPTMLVAGRVDSPLQANFQYTQGFIMDPNSATGLFHYHLPCVMPGSSGAPIFDLSTNKLVGMVMTSIRGYMFENNNGYVQRHIGIPISIIREFSGQVNAILDAANANANASSST